MIKAKTVKARQCPKLPLNCGIARPRCLQVAYTNEGWSNMQTASEEDIKYVTLADDDDIRQTQKQKATHAQTLY